MRRMHYSFCFSERHCRGLSPCTGIVASVAGRAFRTGSNGSPCLRKKIHRCCVERRAFSYQISAALNYFGSDHQPFSANMRFKRCVIISSSGNFGSVWTVHGGNFSTNIGRQIWLICRNTALYIHFKTKNHEFII